jgi:hypothetical protein
VVVSVLLMVLAEADFRADGIWVADHKVF